MRNRNLMLNVMKRLVCRCVVTMSILPISLYAQLPDIEPPPDSQAQWVGENFMQNGLPMSIQAFQSQQPVDAVLAYYREKWQQDFGLVPVENAIGEWRVLGLADDDYFYTVQVKQGRQWRSEGFIAVSNPKSAINRDNSVIDFPKPGGTEKISETSSNDAGRSGGTTVLQNSRSVRANTQFYIEQMASRGWQLRQDGSQTVDGRLSQLLGFERGDRLYQITITQSDTAGSVIIATYMSK